MANPVSSSFTGGIPERYDRCLGPTLFEPYANDLVSRLRPRPGDRVLELAAGTGIVSAKIAATLSDGHLTVTDLNEPMLDVARQKVGQGSVTVQSADACDLPFADASFDAAVCQFGLMFFPDKLGALRHVRRVLKPGGKFHVSVWDAIHLNPMFQTAQETVTELFSGNPPDFYTVPYSLHDREAVRGLLTEAGFSQVSAETVTFPCRSQSAALAAEGLVQGNPIVLQIQEQGPGAVDKAKAFLAERLASRFGHEPLETTMQAHVFEAEV